MNDRWSSPLLHFLTPTDVILFATAFAIAVAAIFRRVSIQKRIAAILIFLAILTPTCYIFIHPPITIDWQQYRDLDRAGKIQYKLMAPLPYSANDYLRDFPDIPLSARAAPIPSALKPTAAMSWPA